MLARDGRFTLSDPLIGHDFFISFCGLHQDTGTDQGGGPTGGPGASRHWHRPGHRPGAPTRRPGGTDQAEVDAIDLVDEEEVTSAIDPCSSSGIIAPGPFSGRHSPVRAKNRDSTGQ